MRENVSESAFQSAVIDYARLKRWQVCHIRSAPVTNRYGIVRTSVPYQGDVGLPDLILARAGRVLLVELKSAKGRATAEQVGWLSAAGENGRLWRPADWDTILDELA